jgi:excisionase family DNA binding protein
MESSDALTFSVQAAANMLCLGKTKLYEEIGAGRLRTVVCGSRRLVTRRSLEDYVALLEQEAAGK